jgi:tRNA nucleotidyltransferase (CCA-adding enzyme)
VLCLSEEKPLMVLKRLGDYNLLIFFHPSLKLDRSMETRLQRLDGVISWYRLLFTGEKFEPWVVTFLGLVDGFSEKELEAFLTRISLPEKFRRTFIPRRRLAIQVAHRLSFFPSPGKSDIFFLLNPLPTEFLLYAMGRTDAEGVKKAISLYFTELKRVKVTLRGQDLKRRGYVPGPVYTEILQSVLRAKLDGKVTSRPEEIDFVRKRFPREMGKKEKTPSVGRAKREHRSRKVPTGWPCP